MKAISLLSLLFARCSVAEADASSSYTITTNTPIVLTTELLSNYTVYSSVTEILVTVINGTSSTFTTTSPVLTPPSATASGLIFSTITSKEVFTILSCGGDPRCVRTTVVVDIITYTVSTGYSTSTVTSTNCGDSGGACEPVTTLIIKSYTTTCPVSTITSTTYESTTVTTTTTPDDTTPTITTSDTTSTSSTDTISTSADTISISTTTTPSKTPSTTPSTTTRTTLVTSKINPSPTTSTSFSTFATCGATYTCLGAIPLETQLAVSGGDEITLDGKIYTVPLNATAIPGFGLFLDISFTSSSTSAVST